MTSQFYDMTPSSIFFDVFFVSLVKFSSGPSFMSISWLVLELWQFYFIRDWPEIRKSEIPSSEFCPISGDWGKLWIPNLARVSLIEYYWMLQNARGYSFYHFWVIKGKLTGGVKLPPLGLRVIGQIKNMVNV